MTYSKDEIFNIVRDALVDLFDIDANKIKPDALLYEDLDIDSIDAVDLIVRLKEKTGKKPDVEAFRHVRTVGDVVDSIYAITKAN
tara:strand:+ start:1228 stop:1482 length:255 start_codon:yes stop_codon:yes gene_type:complete